MKLKSLEIQGFKSFKDKIKLEFNNPICGIVGPNGSGKSNISDAIRWVLGEQSAKSLRGAKMEDIIFGGTEKEKPLNFAQVSMTFDNSDSWIPMEFKEINVARRVFRTGESEYYINKSQVRLREVKELFMDTGIGKEGYSIIGQGRIDEILSSKGEDRRYIFEEASGISKYKYKKEESQKKLAKSKENLARINDILSQQNERVGFLKDQSERAKKGVTLLEKIQEMDVSISQDDLKRISETTDTMITKSELMTKELEESTEQIASISETLEPLKQEFFLYKEDYEKSQREYNDAKLQLDEAQNKKNLDAQSIEFNKRELVRLEEEISSRKSKVDYLVQKKDKEQSASKEKREHIDNLEYKRTIVEEKLKREKEQYNSKESKYEKVNFDLENLIANIHQLEIKKKTQEGLDVSKIRDSENRKKNIQELKLQLSSMELSMNKLTIQREQQQEVISKSDNLLERLKSDFENSKENQRGLKEKLIHNKSLDNELSNKLNFYQGVKDNYEGYYKQVSDFFKEVNKTALKDKVVGTLADLITISDPFVKAIDVLLSGSLQNVVVKNEEDGKILISFLKERRIGRLTFLPISTIRPTKATGKIDDSNILTVASEAVKCDDSVRGIVDYFLNRTLIVKDMESAIIARKKYPSFRIVTLDGDLLNTWGSMVGGYKSQKKGSQGILNRNEEINNLTIQLDYNKKEIRQLEIELNLEIEKERDIQDKISSSILEKRKLSEAYDRIVDDIGSIETQFKIVENNILNENNELSKDHGEVEFNDDDQSRLVEYDTRKHQLSILSDELSKELKIHQNNILDQEKSIYKLDGELEILKRDLLIHDNAIGDCQNELENQNKAIDFNKNLLSQSKETIENLEKNILECEEIIGEMNAILSKLNDNIPLLKSNYETTQAKYHESKDKHMELENQVKILSLQKESFNEKLMDYMERRNDIVTRIMEEYNIDIENYVITEKPQGTKKALKELRDQLKEVGYFSIDSIAEYESVSKEIEFLNGQKEDLLKSKDDIEKIIEELDTKMKHMFKKSFVEINEKFNKIFSILFAGGSASLVLEDEDPLNGGIDIIAEPPGKKLQNLSLLSGGERSLTAVALLFAIFETRPSPFCILDEIDAALDEANIFRYTNYLRSFSERTQFIIITHRKSTMEIADLLYGVSMEEEGISKVITLNLQ